MGNDLSCSRGTPETPNEMLDCVSHVETTSETLLKSLDCHIPSVKKLLKNHETGLQEWSGPSHSRHKFHYNHLEKLDDRKRAVRDSVDELLHAVHKRYRLKEKVKKEQQYLKTSESKSDTFENSELNDLDSYITHLEQENKRLHEQKQTLINENDPFKRKLEQERGANVMPREALKNKDKDMRLCQIKFADSAKDKDKTPESTFTQKPIKQNILENAIDKSEISSILKSVKEYELGQPLPTLDNDVQEKVIEILTVSVQRLIDENRSFKGSKSQIKATHTSARVKLEKQISDLKQEVEQLRITDTLKTQNNVKIAELNEMKNELASVHQSKAEMERVLMSKTQDYQSLQLEKESNSKIITTETSAKEKLEKQITDHKQEVEHLRIKAKLFEEQSDTLKTQNNASVAKLNETTNELAAVRQSNAELERALMSKTQDCQSLQLEKESNIKIIATETSAKGKLEKQITDLKQEVEQLRIKAKLFEEQKDTLKTQNDASIAELNEATNELATVRESKTDMERALMSKTQDCQSLQLKIENNSKIIATETSAREKLEKQITDLKQEVEQLRIKAKLFEEQMDTLKTQNDASIAELNEATNELAAVRESKAEMERALMSKTQDFENLKLEHESLKQDTEKLQHTKVIHVQLYHHNRLSLISEIENDLKALLKIEMEDAMTKLDFVECDKACDIDVDNPVLILCICVSRLGTDATNAIQALQLTSKMALVIFHHKEEHALPKQASERLLTGQVFMHLGGVLDLAFLQSKGIYNCEMNIKNIKSLVGFLNKESAKSVK